MALTAEAAALRLVPPPPAPAETQARLAALAAAVRAELGRAAHPVEALNAVVFGQSGFARVVDQQELALSLLPQVLARKKGSCAGLAAVYLALGEQLKLPLQAVLLPGHLLVRYDPGGPQKRDVELLKKGRQMSRSWYEERYHPPSASPLYWRHPLSTAELLAAMRYNLAGSLRRAGRLREALIHYRQVTAALPDFAEAQANLGVVLQALGREKEARRAYERAQRANPGLSGLEQNVEQLRER